MIPKSRILGVVLAGGKASRMGGKDKPLLTLAGEPIITHVIRTATPQVGALVLSVNHNQHKFHGLGLPVIADSDHIGAGPLAGIHSAMVWALTRPGTTAFRYLACFPADVPWFPCDIVRVLGGNLQASDSEVAWSQCDGQIQPLFSLWSLDCRAFIKSELDQGRYGPKLVIPKMSNVLVNFEPGAAGYFLNINTETQLKTARELAKSR